MKRSTVAAAVPNAPGAAAPNTQVSFVPPPCDELTMSDPSRSATRVSPPGTTVISLPDSTNGRRSMCRGAIPALTNVGDVERASVGCAMYRSGWALIRLRKSSICARVEAGPINIPYPPAP